MRDYLLIQSVTASSPAAPITLPDPPSEHASVAYVIRNTGGTEAKLVNTSVDASEGLSVPADGEEYTYGPWDLAQSSGPPDALYAATDSACTVIVIRVE